MSFTYDLTTTVGQVRLKIQDTAEASAQFSDEEIAIFIAEGGTVNASAGLALLTWAAVLGREDRRVSTGSWTADRGDAAAAMREQAQELFALDGYNPALSSAFAQVNIALWGVPLDE